MRKISRPPSFSRKRSDFFSSLLDLVPENHPGIEPDSIFIQVMALREAAFAAA
jgi:hypothetical protein